MKLHAVIFLAGVFLTHSAGAKPQGGQLLVARGSNVYGAGGGFNPGPFPAVPRQQPNPALRQQRPEQPLTQQLLQPAPAPVRSPAPAPAPAPVEVQINDIGGAVPPPAPQQTPLEEIDLRVTDLTTGGRGPAIGSGGAGRRPTADFSPQRPLVVGSTGQAERRPSLDNVFDGLPLPLASPEGGEIGVGVLGRGPEAVVGFERNSAQAGGEEEAAPLSVAQGYVLPRPAEESVVARGGDTYGAGQSVEVPRPRVAGDLDIRPEQPRTKEDVLSQAALPDSEETPRERPAARARPQPPPQQDDSGEGHHMGGIEWLPESIPGEPLVDYPVLVRVPDSGFDCANQEYDGFFADTSEDARCQAFWVCHNEQQDGFLCPNGTMFNQRYFTCDWWFNVRCDESPDYYELNKNIGVVGTRIDTLPAGVVAAASKVHPVFTLLSEMLHYPRVPPVPPRKMLNKDSSSPPAPKSSENHKTSVKLVEKVQDRQTSLASHPVSGKVVKSARSNLPSPADMLPQFNERSHKRAVGERLEEIRGGGARLQRHRRHHGRSRRHRSRAAPDPPVGLQNQNVPNQARSQNSQSATPEPYIETIQKIDLPMTASGSPKLMDDVTVMEKTGNITLSQAEKQIPLNLPASISPAKTSGQAGTNNTEQPQGTLNQPPGSGQLSQPAAAPPGSPLAQAAPPPPAPAPGQPPVQPGQESPPGNPPSPPQGQPPAVPPQQAFQPAGQPSELTPVQSPVQPQDQPPPPAGQSQSATAPGLGQQTGSDNGLVIDEDVKVEDGNSSAPVEKKLHFPPDPGTAQVGNQSQALSSLGPNNSSAADQNGVSIDEDIKVDEGDPAHPVEEELRYPAGGKPVLIGGPAHGASSCHGATPLPNSTLNAANVRDPSALHHDMPSENAPLDELPKTKAPPINGKVQSGDEIQITSETVSKVVQNPKPEAIRDPSGLQPPKSNEPPNIDKKKSFDEKRESSRSKKDTKDVPREVGDTIINNGKRYPEVRIIGNMHQQPKTDLPSEVSKTVNSVEEDLRPQPKTSEQSHIFDAGTFYLSPRGKTSSNEEASHISPKYPIGVNLKIIVNQQPTNSSNQSGTTSVAVGQAPKSAKSRRMIEPEVPFVADAYDYDLSELPSWMQRAAAVKRSIASPSSSAELSLHNQVDEEAAAAAEQNFDSMQEASRPVRKAIRVSDSQSNEVKRALAAPRVQRIFQSAREELMKLLGGPEESLDSEIDSLLGKRQSDKDKRENDMKLRLDSSSLTSYPEQGLDPL